MRFIKIVSSVVAACSSKIISTSRYVWGKKLISFLLYGIRLTCLITRVTYGINSDRVNHLSSQLVRNASVIWELIFSSLMVVLDDLSISRAFCAQRAYKNESLCYSNKEATEILKLPFVRCRKAVKNTVPEY